MAAVWEARHSHLDIGRLAIKFPLDEFAANDELQRRFLVEAKIESKLRHPNIVSVRDFFQADGRSYMVMAFVEPPRRPEETEDLNAMPLNLEERLRRLPGLTMAEVHTFSTDVLNALQYAHESNVVHRDIKPSNIMLAHDGHALLTDFGIAKILDATQSNSLTGRSIGTPDYMSPEQITAPQTVDARTDIYSFGCVLYAMLSGDPPFADNAATEFSIKYAHVHEPPAPLVWGGAAVPQATQNAIQDVIFRCLEKNPSDRFQSCTDVERALTAAIQTARATQTIFEQKPFVLPPEPEVKPHAGTKPIPPRPNTPPAPSRPKGMFAIAGVVLLILVALVFGYLRTRATPAAPVPFAGPPVTGGSAADPASRTGVESPPASTSTDALPPEQHSAPPPVQKQAPVKSTPVTDRQPSNVSDPDDCCVGSRSIVDCNKARRKSGLGPCVPQNNN